MLSCRAVHPIANSRWLLVHLLFLSFCLITYHEKIEALSPYRNMYLQMNSIASTYISVVILSLCPQARLMTT